MRALVLRRVICGRASVAVVLVDASVEVAKSDFWLVCERVERADVGG